MARVLVHDYWGDHVGQWLSGLLRFHEKRGDTVRILTRNTLRRAGVRPLDRLYSGWRGMVARHEIRRTLRGADHIYVWNGQNEHHEIVRALSAELDIRCSILEVGYFPQSRYFTIDAAGINATSSLMQDDLSWVEERHYAALERHRREYLGSRIWRGGGGYVLVPLQLAQDTNVRDHSCFHDMQEFIVHCEELHRGHRIVFKRHPKDECTYRTAHELRTDGDFLEVAVKADLVYGINSTCLLESALMGAPTRASGRCLLNAHQGRIEALLAALVDKQVPVDCDEIGYWIDRYC